MVFTDPIGTVDDIGDTATFVAMLPAGKDQRYVRLDVKYILHFRLRNIMSYTPNDRHM